MWNSLPNSVVKACSVNAFEACSDKIWLHQDVNFEGGLVARAFYLQLNGCEFETHRPLVLGKLLTFMFLCHQAV